jgi:hypothetical protein
MTKVWAAVYATDPQAGYIVFGIYTSKLAAEQAISWRKECDVQSEDLWIEEFTLNSLRDDHYMWVK